MAAYRRDCALSSRGKLALIYDGEKFLIRALQFLYGKWCFLTPKIELPTSVLLKWSKGWPFPFDFESLKVRVGEEEVFVWVKGNLVGGCNSLILSKQAQALLTDVGITG